MSDRWKPKKGDLYWVVDLSYKSGVRAVRWANDNIDNLAYERGDCFETESEARVAAEKVKGLLLSLHEPVTECNQLPKLTAEVFNRPDCPEWANYAALGGNGMLTFYEDKPMMSKDEYPKRWINYDRWYPVEGTKFDTSDWKDSLIERPGNEKALPDWCMVDNICWHKRCGYFTVTYIDEFSKRVDIQQVDDRSNGYLSFHTVCNEAAQARFRPYKAKEMKSLVGKSITLRDGSVCLCTAWSAQSNQILLDNTSWTAEKLLNTGYAIGDKPCGVFEHLNDKGEWVE